MAVLNFFMETVNDDNVDHFKLWSNNNVGALNVSTLPCIIANFTRTPPKYLDTQKFTFVLYFFIDLALLCILIQRMVL